MSVARGVLACLTVLSAGAAVAAPQGSPALIEAAERGDRVAVSRLLDQGAGVDAQVPVRS